MEKVIKLQDPSTLDDVNCPDGEVQWAAGTSYGSFLLGNSMPVPVRTRFVAVHSLADGRKTGIFMLPDSSLYWGFLDLKGPAVGFLPLDLPEGVGEIKKAVGVGDYLCLLTTRGLLYTHWEGNGYGRAWESPGAQTPVYTVQPAALPPYCNSESDFPSFSLAISVGKDDDREVTNWLAGANSYVSESTRRAVVTAVGKALDDFVAAVRNAGLYISPVMVRATYVLPDGSLFKSSEPLLFPSSADLPTPVLIIRRLSCVDAVLYMDLEFSRRPFNILLKGEDGGGDMKVSVTDLGQDFIASSVSDPVWVNSTSRGFAVGSLSLPDVSLEEEETVWADMGQTGVPDSIYSIGGRLVAVTGRHLLVSSPSYPFVALSVTALSSPFSPVYVTHALTSAAAVNQELPPLLVFCADGIRLYRPSGGRLVESRLVSRDVAVSDSCFAPLPDGTAFITASGVKKVSGTSVSYLSAGKDYMRVGSMVAGPQEDKLVYIYATDTLVRFSSAEPAMPEEFHYGWPEVYARYGDALGLLSAGVESSGSDSSDLSGWIKTRPIKLGNPFAFKKLSEVQTVWPDGSVGQFKVYGANRLDRWHFLGLSRRGRMLMRGSGWRFFRVEFSGGGCWPVIRFVYDVG